MRYSSYDLFGGVEFDNGPDPQQWKLENYPHKAVYGCNHCYCVDVVVQGCPRGKCCKCGDTMMRPHIYMERELAMKHLSLTESLITIALLLGLAFALNYALRTWLLSTTARTTANIERASTIYR